MSKRKTEQDYENLALLKDVTWIGEYPKTTHEKSTWQCVKGHTWETSYHSLHKNKGCPHCAGNVKKTEEDYHKIAQQKGLLWIGKSLPVDNKEKTLWKCLKCGYVWKTKYNVLDNSRGCPVCARKRIANLIRCQKEDYHLLAKRMNFLWIGEFPGTSKGKTFWKCKNGHEWESRYNDIQSGYGCPHCANFINGARCSSQQQAIAEMMGGEINYKVGRKRIDIAFPDIKIAVEYNGWYWHQNREKEDAQRTQELLDSGWKVLVIKSNAQTPLKKTIIQCLKELETTNYIELILDDWKRKV